MFEVAKDFDSLQETKLVTDRRKLYKGMHGMGRLLSTAVDHDPETMKSIQVIGIQNMGTSSQSHYTLSVDTKSPQNSHSGFKSGPLYPLKKLLSLKARSNQSLRPSIGCRIFLYL